MVQEEWNIKKKEKNGDTKNFIAKVIHIQQ